MRALLYTPGSPFARAVRIVLDELVLDYERREEFTTPAVEQRAAATPTLQVPTFWENGLTLWESGLIAEYLISTYRYRPKVFPPLAPHAYRPEAEWRDKLTLVTIHTFGTAATTISQLTWTNIRADGNAHLARCAERLTQILMWLETRLERRGEGFLPGCISLQDIFLAAHVRFIQARPLGIDLRLAAYPKIEALLDRLDARDSFTANPVRWWDPSVIGYEADGTPIRRGTADAR